MNRQDVIRENMVDRYLLGQLSESESDAFEVFYLSCPETLQELETSEQMICGFKSNSLARANGKRRQSLLQPSPPERKYTANWATLAASVCAAVAVGFGISTHNDLNEQRALYAATDTAIDIVSLGATRSSGDARVVRISGVPQRIAIDLDLGFAEAPLYDVALTDINGALLWTATALTPDDRDALKFSIPPGTLVPGRYRLSAEPQARRGNSVQIEIDVQYR